MSVSRSSKMRGGMSCIRPVAVGVIAAILIALALICVASLVFSLIECIAKNMIGPISLIAIAVGCFLGAYICALAKGAKGIFLGAIIGIIFFLMLLIIGCFNSSINFGGNVIIKLLIILISACCGGCMGGKRTYGRRCR